MNEPQDTLFSDPLNAITPFTFDEDVARVFPDMIKRSVPGYLSIVNMTGLMAARYAQPDTRLYDLGCSLGASTLAMRQQVTATGCEIIAVDNSPAMLERCRTVLDTDSHALPVNLHCADIQATAVENASVVVLNFTLQFVPLEDRDRIFY